MHLLNYFRRKSVTRDEDEAAGVELSVRAQARPDQELKPLPPANSNRTAAWLQQERQGVKEDDANGNGCDDPLQAQVSSAKPACTLLGPEALLLNSSLSCSRTRLVLGALSEVAAAKGPQQQHLQQKLQLVVDSASEEAAWVHCMDTLLLRGLFHHYCPGLAAVDDWKQLQRQHPLQETPLACLPAHLVSTLAAAACSCKSTVRTSSETEGFMQLVEHAIVLGEVLQLQQQQEASWAQLLQLAVQPHPAGEQQDGDQQQQDALPQLWHMLQAWGDAVISAAGDNAHQHSIQQHPPQWGQLLRVLSNLQQQVQGATRDMQQQVQDPLQEPTAAAPAEESMRAGPADTQQGGSGQQQLQHQHTLLQQLCQTVPVLLQPADLAAATPDSMALVALARLAAATSSLWLPLLDAAVQAAAVVPAAPAVHSGGGCVVNAGGPAAESSAHLRPGLHSGWAARQDAAAAVWQGAAAEQVVAELAAGPDGTNAASAASVGLSASLKSPRSSWPDELLSVSPQLWPGDVETEDDAAAITREERTLRCWINSLLHRHANSTPAATDQQGPLLQTASLDSRLGGGSSGRSSSYVGHGVGRLGNDATTTPVRAQSQSVGGSEHTAGVLRLSPLHLPARGSQRSSTSSGGGGVFRSSSAGAAAVAAHVDAAGSCSDPPAHSRSISADAVGAAADISLDGWGAGESSPAAPTTPTAAAAAVAAAAGTGAGAGSSSRWAAAPAISSVSSLFGAELRSGVLLLQLLDLLQPGSIDWRAANKPPFVSRTAQLKALENCQLALKIAQEELGLPLVSMSPRDIVLGRRKIILSLVYQLMRYNTMQLLESISAVHTEQQVGSLSRRSSTGADSEPSTPVAATQLEAAEKRRPTQQQQQLSLPPTGFQPASGGRVNIRSSSKKQRRQLAITEKDILDWANTKLQQVKPLPGSDVGAESPVIRSFKDPVLGSGVVLLQLLHVLAPALVDPAYVTPGHTPEQRQSNAKYALSLADRMGCSLFLVWEDLVDPPQPRMVLVLLASLMFHDLQRQQQQQGAYAAA